MQRSRDRMPRVARIAGDAGPVVVARTVRVRRGLAAVPAQQPAPAAPVVYCDRWASVMICGGANSIAPSQYCCKASRGRSQMPSVDSTSSWQGVLPLGQCRDEEAGVEARPGDRRYPWRDPARPRMQAGRIEPQGQGRQTLTRMAPVRATAWPAPQPCQRRRRGRTAHRILRRLRASPQQTGAAASGAAVAGSFSRAASDGRRLVQPCVQAGVRIRRVDLAARKDMGTSQYGRGAMALAAERFPCPVAASRRMTTVAAALGGVSTTSKFISMVGSAALR